MEEDENATFHRILEVPADEYESITKVIDWTDIVPTTNTDEDDFQISDVDFAPDEDALEDRRGGAAASSNVKFSSATEVDLDTVMGALKDAAKGKCHLCVFCDVYFCFLGKPPVTPKSTGTKTAEDSPTDIQRTTTTEAKQSVGTPLLDAAAIAHGISPHIKYSLYLCVDIAQTGSPSRGKVEFTDATSKGIK